MTELEWEKTFYDRFWNLLRDKQLMQVFERYGPEVFRRSCVLEGFEQFIIANGFKGRSVVEIGTLKGLTALVLARHFDHVTSFDIIDDPVKYEIIEMLGVTNVHFFNVANNAEKYGRMNNMAFDAAFVDGNHDADTGADIAHVKHCGRVLLHENWSAQPAVVAAVDRLRAEGTVTVAGKWAIWVAAITSR